MASIQKRPNGRWAVRWRDLNGEQRWRTFRSKADANTFAKLDRLSRSLLDFAGLMERSRREGWALVALDLGLDTSTPQGEMMAAILATFAQFERRLIGERTKSALAELKSQGVVLGRPAAISDEVIGRINQMRTDGVTYRAIAEQLNAEGVRGGHGGQWHAATILRALRARTEQSETLAGAV
jgi:DNA invertase Pin-like site-specific DNA recombinase